MEYRIEKAKRQTFSYTCNECGNEFENNKDIEPYECYDCGAERPFNKKSVDYVKETKQQLCPICNDYFDTSDFLNENIQDEHVRWLANMVTHYRHIHITSWNKVWSKKGYGNHYLSEQTYDVEKAKVNERAKRQILRKCKDYMKKNGFKVEHVKALQNTDNKTIELYEKLLK